MSKCGQIEIRELGIAKIINWGRVGSEREPESCREDPIYVFPEMKLRGLFPNFHIHVSVSDHIQYFQDLSSYFAAAVSFLGIFVSIFGTVSLQCRYGPHVVCTCQNRFSIIDPGRCFRTELKHALDKNGITADLCAVYCHLDHPCSPPPICLGKECVK